MNKAIQFISNIKENINQLFECIKIIKTNDITSYNKILQIICKLLMVIKDKIKFLDE
jgi:hypothetical protein